MLDASTFMTSIFDHSGLARFSGGNAVMVAAGIILIWLGVARRAEPLFFAALGFACIVANIPFIGDAAGGNALFGYAYEGIVRQILPLLIFLGVGALTDFGPVLSNPRLVIAGAGAQLGIFAALLLAVWSGFSLQEAGALGLLGGTDGPLALFVTAKLAPHLLAPVALIAYCSIALMPVLQAWMGLPSAQAMQATAHGNRDVAKFERIGFPILMALVFNLLFPSIAPLITMLLLGNLLREAGPSAFIERTAPALTKALTLILAVAIGSALAANSFLTLKTGQVLLIGAVGLFCSVLSSAAMAWLMALPSPSGAVAAAAPGGIVRAKSASDEGNSEIVLVHDAMGTNLAGVFAAAIAAAIIMTAVGSS